MQFVDARRPCEQKIGLHRSAKRKRAPVLFAGGGVYIPKGLESHNGGGRFVGDQTQGAPSNISIGRISLEENIAAVGNRGSCIRFAARSSSRGADGRSAGAAIEPGRARTRHGLHSTDRRKLWRSDAGPEDG